MLMPKPGNPCHFLTNIPRRFSAILFSPSLALLSLGLEIHPLRHRAKRFFFPFLFFSRAPSIFHFPPFFHIFHARACRYATRSSKGGSNEVKRGCEKGIVYRKKKKKKKREKEKKPRRNSNHGLNLRPGI